MGRGWLRCVTDSNLWIDLHRSRLIDQAFQLPMELVAPDVIIAELQVPRGIDLLKLGLIEKELSGDQVMAVLGFAERYLRPGRADLFALVLALELEAILLTGDGALREAAQEQGLEVHGTIWVLDQMVDQGLIGIEGRSQALMLMLKAGSRLPRDEVATRLLDTDRDNISWL
jgi:predicted nucleic acid-binding protein